MGDFYEMFFDDAEIAAKQLGITLTKRGSKGGLDVPMCGVPVHSVDGYLAKLVRAGHRVAICEQTEDPQEQKQRGGKGPLKRDVVRVLTPGTLTEDELLPARAHNYLVALGRAETKLALAWADMSTGDFLVQEMAHDGLETVLARLDPAELIFPRGFDLPEWLQASQICATEQAASLFDSTRAKQALERFYQVATLDVVGHFSRVMLSAGGALLGYLEATQVGNMPRLLPLTAVSDAGIMEIDPATRRSLELSRTLTGERRGSLLHAVDRTLTAAGGRLRFTHGGLEGVDVHVSDPATSPQEWAHKIFSVFRAASLPVVVGGGVCTPAVAWQRRALWGAGAAGVLPVGGLGRASVLGAVGHWVGVLHGRAGGASLHGYRGPSAWGEDLRDQG